MKIVSIKFLFGFLYLSMHAGMQAFESISKCDTLHEEFENILELQRWAEALSPEKAAEFLQDPEHAKLACYLNGLLFSIDYLQKLAWAPSEEMAKNFMDLQKKLKDKVSSDRFLAKKIYIALLLSEPSSALSKYILEVLEKELPEEPSVVSLRSEFERSSQEKPVAQNNIAAQRKMEKRHLTATYVKGILLEATNRLFDAQCIQDFNELEPKLNR